MSSTFHVDEKNYYVRCGELFVTNFGNIIFHCTLCEGKYADFEKYAKHLRKKHLLDDEDYDSETYLSDETDFLLGSTESMELENSLEGNNQRIAFEVHEKDELNDKNVGISRIAAESKRDVQKKTKRKTNQIYKCNECHITCTKLSNLKQHKQRHLKFKPFNCSDCSKNFYTRTELKRHIATHSSERPFACHDCGARFPSKDKLAEHYKRHLNVRDKVCKECGMEFYDSTTLRKHMLVHSNRRPHKCEFCGTTFKRKTGLNSHIKTHQNKREYQCKFCPSSFNQNAGLYAHMKFKHPQHKNTTDPIRTPNFAD